MIDFPPLVPLRRKWSLEEDMINVEISPTSIEICGGSADGALVDGEMELNLERLRDLFDDVISLKLIMEGDRRDEVSVWIMGTYQGQDLDLMFAGGAPPGEKRGVRWDEARQRQVP